MKYIAKVEKVLNLWRIINRTTQVKIIISKTVTFSKVIKLAIVTTIPKATIWKLKKIQKEFIWSGDTPEFSIVLCRRLIKMEA